MKPARHLASFGVSLCLAAVIAACSFIEPETGPLNQSAVAAPNAYAPKTDAGGGTDPRCLVDSGGSSCDACENALCCTTRFGCYDDPTCNAANTAFDPCIAAVPKDIYNQPDPAATKKCWDTLAASGAAGTARVACQNAQCKVACAVP